MTVYAYLAIVVIATLGFTIYAIRRLPSARCSVSGCTNPAVVIFRLQLAPSQWISVYGCQSHRNIMREFEGKALAWERSVPSED